MLATSWSHCHSASSSNPDLVDSNASLISEKRAQVLSSDGFKSVSVFCLDSGLCNSADTDYRVYWPTIAVSTAAVATYTFAPAVPVTFSFRPPVGGPVLSPVVLALSRLPCPRATAFDAGAGACTACGAQQYVIDPDRGRCVDCPVGATCDGAALAGSPPGSVWMVDITGLEYRLLSCPAGYVVVRAEAWPSLDQCVACPEGKFSAVPAEYGGALWTTVASNATQLCAVCPGLYLHARVGAISYETGLDWGCGLAFFIDSKYPCVQKLHSVTF